MQTSFTALIPTIFATNVLLNGASQASASKFSSSTNVILADFHSRQGKMPHNVIEHRSFCHNLTSTTTTACGMPVVSAALRQLLAFLKSFTFIVESYIVHLGQIATKTLQTKILTSDMSHILLHYGYVFVPVTIAFFLDFWSTSQVNHGSYCYLSDCLHWLRISIDLYVSNAAAANAPSGYSRMDGEGAAKDEGWT